jgi:dGTPase
MDNYKMSQYAAYDKDAIYEGKYKNKRSEIKNDYRSNFARDVDVICNTAAFARMGDKTQVFSFYKNDDITRRWLHIQHVQRIAKNIGKELGLNLDLIDAIALGHDIGHTPFGHRGEKFLSDIYYRNAGKFFNHNVHSVRILRDMGVEVSLQVLDGILSHNGEMKIIGEPLTPSSINNFAEFDKKYKGAYTDEKSIGSFVANTVEGCLVRICDMVAYIGKDRQDLCEVGMQKVFGALSDLPHIGKKNSAIIKAVSNDIIKNSKGQPYILVSQEIAEELNTAKKENSKFIYKNEEVTAPYEDVKPLFERLFVDIMQDLTDPELKDRTYVRSHFTNLEYMKQYNEYLGTDGYMPADVAVDYIAGMTDDYFIDLCKELHYEQADRIHYKGYFDASSRKIK